MLITGMESTEILLGNTRQLNFCLSFVLSFVAYVGEGL